MLDSIAWTRFFTLDIPPSLELSRFLVGELNALICGTIRCVSPTGCTRTDATTWPDVLPSFRKLIISLFFVVITALADSLFSKEDWARCPGDPFPKLKFWL